MKQNKTKAKLECRDIRTGVVMNEHSLDAIASPGYYKIEACDVSSSEGFPADVAQGRISAYLEVSVTNRRRDNLKSNTIGQTITLTDGSGTTAMYHRNSVNRGGKDVWEQWREVAGSNDLGLVTSLDSYTENGILRGTYTHDTTTEDFVLVVVNNSANGHGGTKRVSQYKYSLHADGTVSNKVRVARIDGNSTIWGQWVDLGAATTTDIQDGSITEQKLSDNVREKILDKVDRSSIVQSFGSAEDKVMSQKAVTDELKKVVNIDVTDKTGDDLNFVDANENCIVRFAEGHIITKNFDSRTGVKNSKFISRDIFALGDSTTQGAGSGETSVEGSRSWFDRLVNKIHFRTYRKLAANGATTMKQEGLSNLYSQVTKLPVVGNPIILVMIGTNDINRGHTKGDANATLEMLYEELDDTTSFAEAYRYNLETIKRRLPNAEVIAMMPVTPQPNDESDAESYRDIERTICNALSIPVWEMRNECGISKFCNYGFAQVAEEEIESATVFMADTLHPNNAGYERIANYVAYKLNQYIQ